MVFNDPKEQIKYLNNINTNDIYLAPKIEAAKKRRLTFDFESKRYYDSGIGPIYH